MVPCGDHLTRPFFPQIHTPSQLVHIGSSRQSGSPARPLVTRGVALRFPLLSRRYHFWVLQVRDRGFSPRRPRFVLSVSPTLTALFVAALRLPSPACGNPEVKIPAVLEVDRAAWGGLSLFFDADLLFAQHLC